MGPEPTLGPWPSPVSWQGLCLQRGSIFSQFTQSSPGSWLSPQGSSCTCPQPGGPGTEGCGKNLLATGLGPHCPPAPAHHLSPQRKRNQDGAWLSFWWRGFRQPWESKGSRDITESAWKLFREAEASGSPGRLLVPLFLFLVTTVLARRPVLINLCCQSGDCKTASD